jgi:predicted RNase H-like nuclease (RuvC/YqgF family)
MGDSRSDWYDTEQEWKENPQARIDFYERVAKVSSEREERTISNLEAQNESLRELVKVLKEEIERLKR